MSDNQKYIDALNEAVEMMNASDDGELFLEITSALKQAASNHGIASGAGMQLFVDWANEQLSKDEQNVFVYTYGIHLPDAWCAHCMTTLASF